MDHKYIFNAPYAASKITGVSLSECGKIACFFVEASGGAVNVMTDFNGLAEHWPIIGKYYVNLPDGGTAILDEEYLKSIGMEI